MKWKCVSSVFELMKWNFQFSVTSRPSVPTYPIDPSQSRACGLLSETLEGRRPSITDVQRHGSMRCLKVASFDILATQSVIWAGGTGISQALSWKYSTSVPTQILQDYRTPRRFTSRFKSWTSSELVTPSWMLQSLARFFKTIQTRWVPPPAQGTCISVWALHRRF